MGAYITLLGAPGCGKGTQAQMLASELNIPVVGIGDLIRSEISKKSALGQEVEPIVNSGNLVPDDIIIKIFSANITEALLKNGVITDGFPRNLVQAKAFEDIFKNKSLDTIIIYIKVPFERLKERLLLRGRSDDTEVVIETRNRVYENLTQPILDYFQGNVLEVDGDRDPSLVFSDILKRVTTIA